MRIGIVGGTGREGRGLSVRFATAGHTVTIGSREPARAQKVAEALSREGVSLEWGTNEDACRKSELVVLSVPYSAHDETLRALRSALAQKILLDITVPLRPPDVGRVQLPPGQSAALESEAIVGAQTRVVAALHHISALELQDSKHAIESDVLVCGNDDTARRIVISLVKDLGARGLDAGPLENAVALESMTSVLLHINKVYGSSRTGIRLTGLECAIS